MTPAKQADETFHYGEILETFAAIRQEDQEVALLREPHSQSRVTWLSEPGQLPERLMRNIVRCLHRSRVYAENGHNRKVRLIYVPSDSFPLPPISKFDVVDLVVDTRFSNVTWMNRTPGGGDSWSPISEEHKTKIRVFFDLPVLNEVEDDEGAQDVETTGDGV